MLTELESIKKKRNLSNRYKTPMETIIEEEELDHK